MSEDGDRKSGCSCWTVGIALALLFVIAGIAIPNLVHVHHDHAQSAAIGALKTLQTSQAIFREGDKANDGNLDYGTLSELSATQMIDSVLGSGLKQGYLFTATYSPTTSEFLWFATANPTPPLADADHRAFFTNQSGLIWYTTTHGPIPVLADVCQIDSRVVTMPLLGR
jgi:hypothetical protein